VFGLEDDVQGEVVLWLWSSIIPLHSIVDSA